jgi:endonuclease/exonuclease/phosphatase family metal-dependent hydrolase
VVTQLTVVSWNVLAAPWAAPAYYPDGMDPAVLDRVVRRELVAGRLAELDADVVCLQETTPADLAAIVAALGPGCGVHDAPNGRELWAGWTTAELPWEPNGTAIVWRSDRVAEVATGALTLSNDGNVATAITARVGDTDVHVVSVHLDVDQPAVRREQLRVACAGLNGRAGATVIAGDCNEDTIGTDLGAIASEHGFVDALTAAGNTDPTHPLARPTDDYAPLARLDHVLVRGATVASGRVVDADVWSVDGPGDRMVEGLRRTGSDHLAVIATLTLDD